MFLISGAARARASVIRAVLAIKQWGTARFHSGPACVPYNTRLSRCFDALIGGLRGSTVCFVDVSIGIYWTLCWIRVFPSPSKNAQTARNVENSRGTLCLIREFDSASLFYIFLSYQW